MRGFFPNRRIADGDGNGAKSPAGKWGRERVELCPRPHPHPRAGINFPPRPRPRPLWEQGFSPTSGWGPAGMGIPQLFAIPMCNIGL